MVLSHHIVSCATWVHHTFMLGSRRLSINTVHGGIWLELLARHCVLHTALIDHIGYGGVDSRLVQLGLQSPTHQDILVHCSTPCHSADILEGLVHGGLPALSSLLFLVNGGECGVPEAH